jgi:HSP20 family protein
MSNNNLLTIMDSFFDDVRPYVYRQATSLALPALNVKELPESYEITLTIPGLDASKVKLELIEKMLNITYEHQEESKDNDGTMIREEYKHYSFSRSVNLPKNVDENSVKATSKNGILTIKVNKVPEAHPKTIEIEHL